MAGATVADVGCGDGASTLILAKAYPESRFNGFDLHEPSIDRALAAVEQPGVADRVHFEVLDASTGIPGQYDIITTWDVIHDAVDPIGLLCSIRQALNPDGISICLEINASHKLEENAGPLCAMFYGVSVLYCMTTSLANGGAGLGVRGMHEQNVCEFCEQAGFSGVRRVPLDDPFNMLYEVRA